MWDAMTRAQLVYGLESSPVRQDTLSKVEASQLKGMRRILGIAINYIDRSRTDEHVFDTASQAISTPTRPRKVWPMGLYVAEVGLRLFGHVLRREMDPTFQQLL